jgi:hypothetical protein
MSIDELENIRYKLNSIRLNDCVQENCNTHTVWLDSTCIKEHCFLNVPDVTSILYSNEEQSQTNVWIIFLVFFLLIIILYFIQKTWKHWI